MRTPSAEQQSALDDRSARARSSGCSGKWQNLARWRSDSTGTRELADQVRRYSCSVVYSRRWEKKSGALSGMNPCTHISSERSTHSFSVIWCVHSLFPADPGFPAPRLIAGEWGARRRLEQFRQRPKDDCR